MSTATKMRDISVLESIMRDGNGDITSGAHLYTKFTPEVVNRAIRQQVKNGLFRFIFTTYAQCKTFSEIINDFYDVDAVHVNGAVPETYLDMFIRYCIAPWCYNVCPTLTPEVVLHNFLTDADFIKYCNQDYTIAFNQVAALRKEIITHNFKYVMDECAPLKYDDGANVSIKKSIFPCTPYELCQLTIGNLNPKQGESIFDPVCGRAPFLVAAVEHLINKGATFEDARANVYGADNNLDRLYIARAILYPDYYARKVDNLAYVPNSLSADWKGIFKMPKFRNIVGNPPFQNPGDTGNPKNPLWQQITIEAQQNLVQDEGRISFVTPTSCMSPTSPVFDTFKNKQLVKYTSEGIDKYFPGVGSSFCTWMWENRVNNTVSNINGVNTNMALHDYVIDTPAYNKIHQKVTASTEKMQVLNDCVNAHIDKKKPEKGSTLSDNRTDTHIYEIWRTNANTMYSSVKTKNYHDPKVIFTRSGYWEPFFHSGDIGTGQDAFYILVKDAAEGKNLLSVLNSVLFKFILTTSRFGCGFTSTVVIRNLPLMDLSHAWTDQQLYIHFGLTPDEITIVESHKGK